MRILKAIGAGLATAVCFVCLGCGSIQIANTAHGSTTAPLTIETQLLPSGIANTPYVAVLDAIGGTPSYTWAVTSGSLPAGLALSPSTGVIAGTPTVNGNFSVGLTLTDDTSPAVKKASTTVTIAVAPPPLSVTSTTALFATYQVAYSQALAVTGGTPAYTWSVSSGKLPAGLSLASSTGILSGTPGATGIFSFTVAVTDSGSPAKTQYSAITMNIASSPLKIAIATTAAATAGSAFSESSQASGGTLPYSWSIVSGSLPVGLALNSATGVISGIPSVSGTATFTVAVSDSSNPAQASSASTAIAVSASPLAISAASSAAANAGSAFSETLQANGGTPAYKWWIASGNLPAGLALNSATGIISGVPSTSGTAAFTVSVSDNSSPVQTRSASTMISVAAVPLVVVASSLPSVMVGNAYNQTLQASGGTAPYTWSISSGQLAAGLTLSSAGTISGAPTANGTSSFTATVTDSSSPIQSASTTKAITVTATPLTASAPVLPAHPVGTAYSQSFSASGGTAPYSWRISSGSLPTGLTLTQAGVLSGTAQASGATTFTATVSDSSNPNQSASATAGMTVTPTSLLITSSTLAGVTVGSTYSQSLQATGGTAPYQWSITSGNLPAGLSLIPSSGAISGIASASGTAAFTVTVTDSSLPAQVTSTTSSLAVAPVALSIVATTLAQTTSGTAYTQTLHATGGTAPYIWSISSGQLPLGLSLSNSGVISGIPVTTSTSGFTVAVTDNGSPAQVQSASLTIAAAASQVPPPAALAITSSALSGATDGTSYSQTLQASGGTPGYTWSLASGSLPAGLTLGATSGTISGTPSASGTFNFTVAVNDISSPVKTTQAATSIVVSAPVVSGPGTTWFVRPDGGTRFSANVPTGECDGLSDTAYSGSGINQHCAFNDVRYLWDDDSGNVGAGTWVIAGGDTVVVRGCHALATQNNAVNPDCRIGWDQNGGGGPSNLWCQYVGSYTCYNPPIPAGTASQHTRILGACAYGTYSCTPINNNYPYTNSNETQIFGGMGLTYVLNLQNTQYVDIEGIELTTHNGQCTRGGNPAYPRSCNSSSPLDDYAQNGFLLNNQTSNITLQDVYVHGLNASGFHGPIGGPITMTRVFSGFNGFSGWNFDDGSDTPDAAGSQILASYVTMIGNGCYEQYPIVNTAFPAQACYDDVSGGFGDAWSGQDTELDVFTCSHCLQAYNTKDAFIGPHTNVETLTITNSQSYGNMGAQWKWNNAPNATTTFENNLTIGNCVRLDTLIPGAAQNFAASTGLPGSYLSDFCRAGGNTVAINSQQNSYVLFANNTFVDYLDTVVLMSCGPSNNNQNGMCGNTPFVFTDNIFLSYYLNGNLPPGLFYINDSSITVTSTNNIEYGNRTNIYGASCGTGGNICSDPLLVNEPPQQGWVDQTYLDNFNFHLTSTSPAIGAGVTFSTMLATDFYGVARQANPSIGAVEP